MSDALIEGLLLGTMVNNGKLSRDIQSWEVANSKLKAALVKARSERDGFAELTSAIVKELSDPASPRVLTDPKNQPGRQAYLDRAIQAAKEKYDAQ